MKKLYHPLCHLVNGERLYFIVISFHNDPFNSADLLVEKMKENGLNASSCAHLIFGDMDVILRVWASELIVSDLILYLESNKNIDTYSLKLIENLMPWYSREIEDNGNVFTLSKADIDDILSNKIKDSLIYFYKQNHRDIFSYKFWVIVEEPYSSNSGFYSQFNTKLNGSKKIKDFDGTFNISLYSYMTSTKRGFIFKANTNNFVMSCDKITALIHELSVDNEYKISTYIARKQLKDDEDLVNFGKNPHVPIETRKRKILYNLLKSHDCNKLMFEDDADELDTLETYVDNLLPVFYDIFKYNKDWCEKVRVSRNITKWVVEEKNSMIISFLLREYVTLESKCRGILDSIYVKNASKLKGVPGIARQIQNIGNMSDDKYKEIESIIKKKFVPLKLTFGDIPHLLSILVKFCPTQVANDVDCVIINKFSSLIEVITKQRNSLAHGEVDFLFKNNPDNSKWLWQDFILAFMQYHFFNNNLFDILRKYSAIYGQESQ